MKVLSGKEIKDRPFMFELTQLVYVDYNGKSIKGEINGRMQATSIANQYAVFAAYPHKTESLWFNEFELKEAGT